MKKLLVHIGHPAHVHLFKNLIWAMSDDGWSVKTTVLEKEINKHLLDLYDIEYECIGTKSIGLKNKILSYPKNTFKLYNISKKFRQDICVSIGSPYASLATKLTGGKSIAFYDSEPSFEQYMLFAPFTDTICTPVCFSKDLGKKQLRYSGYHELAYLHPNRFTPDPDVLTELGLDSDEDFFVLRFVSWQASHDVLRSGFSLKDKISLANKLSKKGRVLITSENNLPHSLSKYALPISPDKIHDVLYYAKLLVGDTQTMTTEAAVLGTPAVRCNSFVGEKDMANFIELEKKYGLIFNYPDSNKAIKKSLAIADDDSVKQKWSMKKEKLLKDKIDVTSWMVDLIKNYI